MKKLRALLVTLLVLVTVVALASCGCSFNPNSGSGNSGGTTTTPPPPPSANMVEVVANGTSWYQLVLPNRSAIGGASDVGALLRSYVSSTYGISLRLINDKAAPTEGMSEILICDTNRDATATVVARLAEIAAPDTYYYVVAEVNGDIVLYASAGEISTNYVDANYESANFLMDYFLATYATEDGIAVPEGCFDVQSLTVTAYNEMMEAIELKKQEDADRFRQEQIDQLKEDIGDHRMADFGRITEMDNIYSEPEYTPTVGSHPRIMVTEQTLPAVRARFEEAKEEVTPAFRSLRDYYTTETDGILPDTPEGTSNYNAKTLGVIESKAFYYLMTGDELYGYEAIRAMKNYLLTFEIYEADLGGDICRYFGYIMYTVGLVYDWCYDLLTVADYNHFIAGVHSKIGPNMEVGFPPKDQGGVTGHGSEAQVLRDYLGFAMAVYDESPWLYNYVCGRIQDVHVPPINWFGESGSHWQGTNYGPFRFYNSVFAETLMSFMSNGEHHFFDIENMREMAMTFVYYRRPDDQLLWIGDTGNQGVILNKSSSYALDAFYMACITGDKLLMESAMTLFGGDVRLSVGGTCLSPATYFCIYDPEVFESDSEEESPAVMPLVRYNGSPLGQYIARSAWDDKDAVMVYMKIAEAYSANHEHKDAGNFQIFYKGNLATDSGIYDTYVNPHGAGYYRQSVSSNTLLIFNPNYSNNGNWIYSGGQSIHKTGATNENSTLAVWQSCYTSSQAKIIGTDYETIFDADGNEEYIFSYLAGDLTNAYDDDTVDEVSRYMISVMTGDPDNPMAFVVYDRITSVDASYKKTFLLHVQEKPVIDDVTNTAIVTNTKKPYDGYQNNGKLLVQSLLGDVTYSMVGGSKGEEVGGVINETDMQFAIYSKKPIYEYNEETQTWSKTGAFKPLGYHNYPAYEYAMSSYAHTPENPYDPVEKLGEAHEYGWGRIEISPAEANLTDRLLTVMYVTDADNEAAQVMASEIKNDYFVGALLFGKAVLFPVDGGAAYTDEMTFTVAGEGEIEYYISGLAAGKWIISVNGVECGSGVVSDKGILRVTAAAGEITLTPAFSSLEFDFGGGRLNNGITIPDAYNYGDTFALPSADTTAEMNLSVDIVKLGSRFLGWYDNPEFTGDPITSLDASMTGPRKFYAKWEKIFAVVDYEPNGGVINETYEYRLDDGTSLTPPTDVTRDGYYFIGWFSNPACTPATRVEIVTTEYANAEGDVMLYAGWRVAFAAENYESEKTVIALNSDTENQLVNGITYSVNGFVGATFDKLTDEDGNSYVQWVGGEDASAMSILGNLAAVMQQNEASSMTVALDLAKLEEIAATRAVLRLRGNGMSGAQEQVPLLHIGENGEVYLGFGVSTVLTTLTTSFSEVAVAVDFENGKLHGYVNGELTATVDFAKPATGGGATTLDWMATLAKWVVDLNATTPNEGEPAERTLLVDNIRAYVGAYGE